MQILAILSGFKSYIAAVGLVGLAVYQVTQGQFDTAIQTALGALAVVGLRHAIAKQAATA